MEDANRMRRKDTTKGPPLRILSLDGGGVRGYSMLIILQELMHKTFVEIEGRAPRRDEIPRPCDYFDLIAGNGTGGLIAILLGRLRLDLDKCKDLYVRMTRRVFETDKTIAGIPWKTTMYKASKLEEALKECVKEHTVSEFEGNDTIATAIPMSPDTSTNTASSTQPQRSMSQSSRYSQMGMSPVNRRFNYGSLQLGNPNTLLYDSREARTKTAVTAVYKGTSVQTLLRSYDSRKETAPDVNCTIWEAGRATSAVNMAFKPIQIGQSVYLDEGGGKYNPSPLILDEAVKNEWPGREVGVFVSIGTGKRPAGTNDRSHEWWEGFLGGSMGDFADARRRMIAKLEGCEDTHQFMLREYLASRGVHTDNYYRLNVEVGVGEFGMNEWARLSEMSTSTRMYLAKSKVEALNQSAAMKLAKIHFAKQRAERAEARGEPARHSYQLRNSWENAPGWERPLPAVPPPSNPMAFELPGDEPYQQTQAHHSSAPYEHRPSIADEKYVVFAEDGYGEMATRDSKFGAQTPPNQATQPFLPPYTSPGSLRQHPAQRLPSDHDPRRHDTNGHGGQPPQQDHNSHSTYSPPPLPPKTPLTAASDYPESEMSPAVPDPPGFGGGPRTFMNMGELGRRLPYPDVEGPPPAVNTASKPQTSR